MIISRETVEKEQWMRGLTRRISIKAVWDSRQSFRQQFALVKDVRLRVTMRSPGRRCLREILSATRIFDKQN